LPGRPSRQLAPLGVAGFRFLFFSTLASSFGTLLAAVALAIDVKDRTNSGLWVGAVLLVEFVPAIVVGLTLGPLLDRLNRRQLMITSDLVRAGVFAALPFATSPGTIVGLAAVAGLATGFFRPAVYAGVPNLVDEELLGRANALLQTIENVSWAAGPIAGGVISAAAGPHAAYWINAASFLVSAVLVARIPARMLQSETALTRGHWSDLKDGFATVFRTRYLLAVLVGWGLALAAAGATNVSEVFMAKNTLHAGDFGYGLIYGAIGVGLVIGGFFSSTLIERLGVARTYGLGIVLMAVGFGTGAASVDIWMCAVCCAVSGVGNGVAVVCNAMLVQRTPDAVRGRALTFVMSATWLWMAASIVVTGALMSPTDARWVWGVSAALLAAGALVGYALAREPAEARAQVEPANI
jgi:MFS family permease